MKLQQPAWPRILPTALVVGLATLGPIGRRLPAPGTWGSAAGLLYFTLFFQRLTTAENLIASAVALYLAVVFCGEAEVRLRKQDPGEVILDEFVAMPLCFLGWRELVGPLPVWGVLLAGFALFRFFDIVKPLGIRGLQKLPGGWGVAVDDAAAALAACVTLHLGVWLWTR
ncbi:MAG TPA: phosphatidylglycerophosphatase A [Opitutaceae bacterium]|nr:phosphatidylglycerophosphatase A [Opitutaceae bacterium]